MEKIKKKKINLSFKSHLQVLIFIQTFIIFQLISLPISTFKKKKKSDMPEKLLLCHAVEANLLLNRKSNCAGKGQCTRHKKVCEKHSVVYFVALDELQK